MALLGQPEASRGILGAIKGALGLFDSTNKAEGLSENVNPLPIDEYQSKMSDKDILELVDQWKKKYEVYFDPIDKSQKLAFNYWAGKHRSETNTNTANLTTPSEDVTDNLIFEAVETFLPIATRANPDPLVSADETEEGQRLAHDTKSALVNWADTQKLRRKLARMTRHWSIYRIGVAMMVWDVKTKEIKLEVIKPNRIVFDTDGYIDEGGRFKGEYIGRKRKDTADTLITMFPSKKQFILDKADEKKGTKLDYYEWWYKGTDVFYTLGKEVLGKFRNPHWNYDGETSEADPETGAVIKSEIQGVNHFKEPQNPFVFLAIFNTGEQPHDDTSLILQNISIQDLINRRYRQIDKNVEGMNNGMVVSGEAFTEEQAAQAASALRRGVAIRVPRGDVRAAAQRFPAPELPGDVFNSLQDARGELRNIFGTSGSTPEGVQDEKSVRGKIMVSQQDSSRIGGGITEQIEQVADTIYNWVVQMMFVYYDEEHFLTAAGAVGGMELIVMKNTRFAGLKSLIVTVKEGSLIPKDPMTKRNEAIDLWSANAIDPLSFYKALDFPDPVNATQQLILWQLLQKGVIPPEVYLPSFKLPQPMGNMAPTQGGPAVNNLDVGQPTIPQTPSPQSPEAVSAESKQLIREVPISP